jgi:hypothetical protein
MQKEQHHILYLPSLEKSCGRHGYRHGPPTSQLLRHRREAEAQNADRQAGGFAHGHSK